MTFAVFKTVVGPVRSGVGSTPIRSRHIIYRRDHRERREMNKILRALGGEILVVSLIM